MPTVRLPNWLRFPTRFPVLSRRIATDLPADIAALRMAVIADAFTAEGLSPECKVELLAPSSWKAQLDQAKPHLLFVESCWHGPKGEWRGLVQSASEVLRSLVSHCRRRGIPTVFWAKEDPTHWEDFQETARLFDWVFTTDSNCVDRYKLAFGHDRVRCLQFAIQPRLHHPIATGGMRRISGTMFAGAWYENFPRRCAEFSSLADGVSRAGVFHIYRRDVPDGQVADYPSHYRHNIRPGVPYRELPSIYRAYELGLTINTVTDSPTMFARRALELLGCGTKVVSNGSLAIETKLAGLVEVCRSEAEAESTARYWLEDACPEERSAFRAKAVREAHWRYDWRSRILEVVACLDPRAPMVAAGPTKVFVIAKVASREEADRIADTVKAQVGVAAELWLCGMEPTEMPPGVFFLGAQGMSRSPAELFGPAALIAPLHVADWHGPHYLLDLVLGRQFNCGRTVGRACYMSTSQGGRQPIRINPDHEYRLVESLAIRRMLFEASDWKSSVSALGDEIETGVVEGAGLVSIDGQSYVENGGMSSFTSSRKWDQGAQV